MRVDKELLKHVAEIARLKLTEAEIEEFIPEFKEILESFSELDKVNTDKTEPSFQPVELKNVMREDKVQESITQEQALSNSPHSKDGYFKGPKAI
jgi:aspartyl-tRNA(Asn)/glutamyl-tRNA(Gln) amidotransferase subunit C